MNEPILNLEDCQHGEISLLFVGDPNLGEQGFEIVHRHFTNASCAIWRRGDAAQAREIKRTILSRPWSILVSFYNDLLFSETELSQADIALNIHPSSPCLRGVGYDTLPLVFGHTAHGVTLHHMVAEPDAGKIIDLIEEPLPHNVTSSELRLRNQRLCLKMLKKTALAIHGSRTPSQIRDVLNMYAEGIETRWSSEYFSRTQLNTILDELCRKQPEHRVFR